MQTTIRPYQDHDLSDLLAVWESASKLAHPFLTAEHLQQVRQDIPNVYIPNAETWIVNDGDKLIGFIALIGAEVGALFVDPGVHGRGFGKALMDRASSLRSHLEVEVFKDNAIGRRFYDRYGFEFQHEKIHEETGNMVLRLSYTK